MQVTKWYLDCVSDDGEVAIAYWLRLGWQSVALTFVSSMLFVDGRLVTRSRLARAAAPVLDGEQLAWQAGDIKVEMQRRAPAVSTSLLDDTVQWRCELPSADARIRVGGVAVEGRGYAEVLRIATAPWKLPIQELRWGRFTGLRSSAVWIDWRGPQPLTLAAVDGQRAQNAAVGDGSVAIDGALLTLSERQVLRDAPLSETLADVPLLGRILPRRLTDADECKWRSRGSFRAATAEVDHGWCIHEVVRFP